MTNVSDKPQGRTTNHWIDEWLDEAHKASIRMSQDESFRQEVAARATNWAKEITPEIQAELDRRKARRANFMRQNQEFIDHIDSLMK